jgi:site-specific DNA-methyltransferase (adenine-specific)
MTDVVQIGDATLYHGDCLDILPTLPKVDAVITDPPYGIGFAYESHDDNTDGWYDLMHTVVPLMQSVGRFVVMPACDQQRIGWWYQTFPPTWLIAWFKGSPGHLSKIGFNSWEAHLCWGKPQKQMHDHFQTPLVIDINGHPCPKPVAYAEWLAGRSTRDGATVADPFMGSGTTGVACVNLGRKFIGIEIERKYFDIACERITNAYRQARMFA